jgi:branched-chain amino acid transport system ATP-binding protein
MLKINDIHTYYGNSYVLQGISLEVRKGTVVGILGRNGVGKTTLIRSIIGFSPVRRGQILFKDVDITHLPSYKIARMHLGLVPQGRRIFPSLTVQENLTIAARDAGLRQWDQEKIFSLFPRIRERLNNRGNELSGGEQQMLAIARGLMLKPKLILLDEPSLGLAPLLVSQIFETTREINRKGITVLLVEQNVQRSLEMADQAVVLENGRITLRGKGQDLLADDHVKRAYLGL